MKKLLLGLALISSQFAFSADPIADAIREAIIDQSINSYQGSCPCPFNMDRSGRRCGKRSAYTRTGGFATICYKDDISDEDVKKHQ